LNERKERGDRERGRYQVAYSGIERLKDAFCTTGIPYACVLCEGGQKKEEFEAIGSKKALTMEEETRGLSLPSERPPTPLRW
jgi:hypothetical protein